MKQRVSLVTLGVTDLARARQFYEALGWQSGASPADDVVFFQSGDMVLALWDRAQLAEDSCVDDSGGWGGVTLAINLGSPVEVDAVIDQARAAGATVGREPAETFWGGYSAIFIDPDGHPWEVAHNPHWTLTPDGGVRLNSRARWAPRDTARRAVASNACGAAYRDDRATNCDTCVIWVSLSWSEKAGIPAAPPRTLLSTAAASKPR